MKHIREAIRLAGVPTGQCRVVPGNRGGHLKIYIGVRFVVASSTPKDHTVAAVRIARDLKKMLDNS